MFLKAFPPPFLGDTHAEMVPIGQNVHQVRGAKTKAMTMPTSVVATMMFQNTRPVAFQSPHAPYICQPNMAKIKPTMNKRKPFERTKAGMGLCGEYLPNTRS